MVVPRPAQLENTDAGKIPIGWHEMGRNTELPAGTVGQYWSFRTPREGTADETLSFVRAGGAVIMSPADVTYLDIVYEEGDTIGQDWADGAMDLRSAYERDPGSGRPRARGGPHPGRRGTRLDGDDRDDRGGGGHGLPAPCRRRGDRLVGCADRQRSDRDRP